MPGTERRCQSGRSSGFLDRGPIEFEFSRSVVAIATSTGDIVGTHSIDSFVPVNDIPAVVPFRYYAPIALAIPSFWCASERDIKSCKSRDAHEEEWPDWIFVPAWRECMETRHRAIDREREVP